MPVLYSGAVDDVLVPDCLRICMMARSGPGYTKREPATLSLPFLAIVSWTTCVACPLVRSFCGYAGGDAQVIKLLVRPNESAIHADLA